MNNLYFKT